MPPPNYKSLSIPSRVYVRVQAVQAEVQRDGYGTIPTELLPDDREGGVTVGFILDAALNALERVRRDALKSRK